MSATTPALIGAAAGVGFGHAILPDHWLPLAVVGRTRRYPIARVARLSGLAGLAHVLVSLVLGGVIVAVGLQFRSTVEHAQNVIVGALLLATGVAFAALELSGHGHSRGHEHGQVHSRDGVHAHAGQRHQRAHEHDAGAHDHDAGANEHDAGAHAQHRSSHVHDATRGRLGGVAGVMVPFGAAASPDLTILPVFLAATAVGTGTAVGSLVAFATVTITTIVGLTLIAATGGYRLSEEWLERWGNAITAGVLIVIGVLVLAGLI
jgi:nickel/cobalt transporter (NicO) family protein